MTITTEVLKHSLPDKFKNSVNDELLNNINNTLSDPDLYETYRDNFLSYMSVLNDGRYKITDYLNAVKYCTQRLMGKSQIDSYIVTFPDRYNTMIQNGKSSKDISSIVTVYNKSKLVNAIMEQSLIPSYILNQDLYQKAINVQAELMNTASSEKVRSDAANSLLTHLKPPETKKVELDIGLKHGNEVEQLRNVIAELAGKQRKFIEAGVVTAKETAEQRLIGKVIDHE
jgi:hypothetical protein